MSKSEILLLKIWKISEVLILFIVATFVKLEKFLICRLFPTKLFLAQKDYLIFVLFHNFFLFFYLNNLKSYNLSLLRNKIEINALKTSDFPFDSPFGGLC